MNLHIETSLSDGMHHARCVEMRTGGHGSTYLKALANLFSAMELQSSIVEKEDWIQNIFITPKYPGCPEDWQ